MNQKEKIKINLFEKNQNIEISGFYAFRINKFFPTHIDILIEYVKNQKEFNIFTQILLKKINNKNIEYLSYILKYAKSKGFVLPKINNKKHIELIKLSETVDPIQLGPDRFGPRIANCISYTREDINVIFMQNISDLITYFNLYLMNTDFIGIDTEWRGSLDYNIKTETAIMQLSEFKGKNILILDMMELIKDNSFIEIFQKLFINKKFIGFDIENDLINLPNELNLFFREKTTIIDIKKLYEIKYMEKCPAFANVCEKIIGKPLCKYEQCSNWERRPLRESQLHYAALDALLCCIVFKSFIEK